MARLRSMRGALERALRTLRRLPLAEAYLTIKTAGRARGARLMTRLKALPVYQWAPCPTQAEIAAMDATLDQWAEAAGR